MARKKNSVALFEVISKTKDNRGRDDTRIPDWAGRQPQSADAATPEPQDTPPPQPDYQHAGEDFASSLADTAPRRLTVTLNYVSCAVAAAVLIVLVGGAFWLGRVTGPAGPVRGAGVGVGGDKKAITPGNKAKTPKPAIPKRVPGKYYLVIQQLPGKSTQDLVDARGIAKFCNANNTPAKVWQTKNYYYVWAFRAFDSYPATLAPEALSYARGIEKLGKEYSRYAARSGGKLKRHDFRQRKGGKLEPHFKLYSDKR